MAEPTVTLGGKLWHLRYDTNAIAELEDVLKLTIREVGVRLMKGKMGVREIRALTWAGMLHENEDLGIRLVGSWLNEAGFLKDEQTRDTLAQRVLEALESSFPKASSTDGKQSPN